MATRRISKLVGPEVAKHLDVPALLYKHRKSIFRCIFASLFYILVSVYYNQVEGWDVLDCVYYITVTITTVGYGDFHPTTDNARIFTVFVIFFGLTFIFGILNDFAKFVFAYIERQAAVIHNIKEAKELHLDPYKYAKKRTYSVLCILLLIILGSFFFWKNENWTFAQAFYWCVVTTTTVGYGDMALTHDSSRLFLIFYIPLSVCVVAGALGNFAACDFEKAAEEKKLANMQRKLDINMIREMDVDGGGVDRCAFLVAMLVANGVCEKERDIDPWLRRFSELDADGSGRLDEEDIRLLEEQEEARLREVNEVVCSSRGTSVDDKATPLLGSGGYVTEANTPSVGRINSINNSSSNNNNNNAESSRV